MRDALTNFDISRTRLLSAGVVLIVGGAFLWPVGDDNAVQWLIDLCLPDGAAAPDFAPIAMEHQSHLALKAAGGLSVVSAVLLYFGLRPPAADPDKMLAAMAYMANATPGRSARELSRAVEQETGFAISSTDAVEAMACYRGAPSRADLDWLSEATSPRQAQTTLSAAIRVGWNDRGLTPEGVKTVASMAQAFGWSGDALAELLPKTPTAHTAYDPFPIADSLSHWICGALEAFTPQHRTRPIGVHS